MTNRQNVLLLEMERKLQKNTMGDIKKELINSTAYENQLINLLRDEEKGIKKSF